MATAKKPTTNKESTIAKRAAPTSRAVTKKTPTSVVAAKVTPKDVVAKKATPTGIVAKKTPQMDVIAAEDAPRRWAPPPAPLVHPATWPPVVTIRNRTVKK